MHKRVVEDVAWLSSPAAQNALAVPRLVGFEASTVPSAADVATRERAVVSLIETLTNLYNKDVAAFDQKLPSLLSLVSEGGATVSDAQRRARALAQDAGCEMPLTLMLLSELYMSSRAGARSRATYDLGEFLHRAAGTLLQWLNSKP
jgi:hypothetical protein